MQDVWTELGRPCGIHQKQVAMMHEHFEMDYGVFMLVIHISFHLRGVFALDITPSN